jgi:predicted AAA+ superfamily ATPase
MFFQRNIYQNIKKDLFKGKVVILYGARRTGKTTLVKKLLEEFSGLGGYYNCELERNKELFHGTDVDSIYAQIKDYKLVVLDEAQEITNIGKTLKALVDTYPEIQIVATGSSSFDLANKTGEPLLGRRYIHTLTPFCYSELRSQLNPTEIVGKLPLILRYGLMPSVFNKSEIEAARELEDITSGTLLKDILIHENIKEPKILTDLLRALAFQVGGEVKSNELAQTVGVHKDTVNKYLDLLEKIFVIFSIPALSKNFRNEISKSKKYFFWDLGIRNSLILNHNSLEYRDDIGGLWENFIITEMVKKNLNSGEKFNNYFWRTYQQKEIDYIIEKSGNYFAFEIKWSPKKQVKAPIEFITNYPNSTFEIVNRDNFVTFLS